MGLADKDYVLGIWDGHDSGAALLSGDQVLFAINEERLTRRKLEICFPRRSIQACLEYAGLEPSQIPDIAYSTTDFAKTLTRAFPALKEQYYQIRRRRIPPSFLTPLKKNLKYRMTLIRSSRFTRFISDRIIGSELAGIGLKDYRLHCVDHHTAHAAGAYFSSFKQALVITLDGIGDGESGGIFRFESGVLKRLGAIAGRDSLGLFYEHVTNLMNMRELEDEGKVMALANYALPVPDEKNPMLRWVEVEGLRLRVTYPVNEMHQRLKQVLWQYPAEQFCYMAQRTLELRITALVKNWAAETGLRNVVLSGGVASNVKANRLVRQLPEVDRLYVFPHMGDGGQAIGSACIISQRKYGHSIYRLNDGLSGPTFNHASIEVALRSAGVQFHPSSDVVNETAQMILAGQIVMWFQGRMEIGPRALGARSILALPGSTQIKDELNLKLKRRVWYQPFCPSMLEETAKEVLEDFVPGTPEPFMTNAYQVKKAYLDKLAGVINVDGTCRPQILVKSSSRFYQLLEKVREMTGLGALLNTSFNIHGEPLVCSPEDALRAFSDSGADNLVMEDCIVSKR